MISEYMCTYLALCIPQWHPQEKQYVEHLHHQVEQLPSIQKNLIQLHFDIISFFKIFPNQNTVDS